MSEVQKIINELNSLVKYAGFFQETSMRIVIKRIESDLVDYICELQEENNRLHNEIAEQIWKRGRDAK